MTICYPPPTVLHHFLVRSPCTRALKNLKGADAHLYMSRLFRSANVAVLKFLRPRRRSGKVNRRNSACRARDSFIVRCSLQPHRKTSKVGRNNEITQGRSSHEHGSVDHSNSSVGWGTTSLALQFRLGILAKWRIGLGSLDCDHPRLDGARLNDPYE